MHNYFVLLPSTDTGPNDVVTSSSNKAGISGLPLIDFTLGHGDDSRINFFSDCDDGEGGPDCSWLPSVGISMPLEREIGRVICILGCMSSDSGQALIASASVSAIQVK